MRRSEYLLEVNFTEELTQGYKQPLFSASCGFKSEVRTGLDKRGRGARSHDENNERRLNFKLEKLADKVSPHGLLKLSAREDHDKDKLLSLLTKFIS